MANNSNSIFVNQIGYGPDSKKFAFIPAAAAKGFSTFDLVNQDGKVVFSG